MSFSKGFKVALLVLFVAVGSLYLVEYLKFSSQMAARIALACLSLFACFVLARNPRPSAREVAVFSIFSAAFDLSLIMGYHIVIGDDTYSGLIDNSHITDYSLADLVAFAFIFVLVLAFSLATYSIVRNGFPSAVKEETGEGNHARAFFFSNEEALSGRRSSVRSLSGEIAGDRFDISPKHVIVLGIVLFVAWIPYLVVYYPGLIFGDTLNSFGQIVGTRPLNDHHPLLYTMFIKLSWDVSHLFGFGNAAGCALYSVLQMAVMALSFSYVVNWGASRARLTGRGKWVVYSLGIVFFGVSPYVASYSIAMWKDPLFSVSLMMVSLYYADIVVFKKQRTGKSLLLYVLVFAFFAFLAVFFRHNGVYILVLGAAGLALWLFFTRCKGRVEANSASARCQAKWAVAITAIIVAFCMLSGPLFSHFGVVKSSPAEALGIPLNQMARVAASGGEMSEGDKEYLNSVLPIELYPVTYRPCCTDMLKWNENFNEDALSNDFFEHWLSMFIKNPRTYLEAWELQTCGFWAVNVTAVNDFGNISGGVVYNNRQVVEQYGISKSVGIQNKTVRSLFPLDESSIPVGVMLWLLLYLACCLLCAKRFSWLVVLVPSLALMATLLVASPIWYWPRYAAAVQFMLPLYLLVFYCLRGGGKVDRSRE